MTAQTLPNDLVYAIVPSQNFVEDGICYAARNSGLFRSNDGGSEWQLAYEALEPGTELPTTALALSPSYSSDCTLFAGVPGGIMRSENAGSIWYFSSLASPPPLISTLSVSPNFARDSTLLAGTMEDGLFRSEDRGVHWMACNFGLTDLSVLTLTMSPDFGVDDMVYLGTETGLFYSNNGGVNRLGPLLKMNSISPVSYV